jgi:hypothetical protein
MRALINYTHSEKSPIAIFMMKDAIDKTRNVTNVRTESGHIDKVEKLVCNIGSTEYNSSINLVDDEGGCVAHYLNGQFWSTRNGSKVTLEKSNTESK